MLQVFGPFCELVHDSVYKALFSDICLAAEHGSGNAGPCFLSVANINLCVRHK